MIFLGHLILIYIWTGLQFSAYIYKWSVLILFILKLHEFIFSWCGPCKILEPRLEVVIGKHHDKVHLAKVDIDTNAEIAMEYNVRFKIISIFSLFIVSTINKENMEKYKYLYFYVMIFNVCNVHWQHIIIFTQKQFNTKALLCFHDNWFQVLFKNRIFYYYYFCSESVFIGQNKKIHNKCLKKKKKTVSFQRTCIIIINYSLSSKYVCLYKKRNLCGVNTSLFSIKK